MPKMKVNLRKWTPKPAQLKHPVRQPPDALDERGVLTNDGEELLEMVRVGMERLLAPCETLLDVLGVEQTAMSVATGARMHVTLRVPRVWAAVHDLLKSLDTVTPAETVADLRVLDVLTVGIMGACAQRRAEIRQPEYNERVASAVLGRMLRGRPSSSLPN